MAGEKVETRRRQACDELSLRLVVLQPNLLDCVAAGRGVG